MEQTTVEKLVTARVVSEAMGMAQSQVYRLAKRGINNGGIPSYQVGEETGRCAFRSQRGAACASEEASRSGRHMTSLEMEIPVEEVPHGRHGECESIGDIVRRMRRQCESEMTNEFSLAFPFAWISVWCWSRCAEEGRP